MNIIAKRWARGNDWLANKLLALSERFPASKRGPLAHLQRLRARQQEDAERAARITRRPADVSLKYLYYRTFESYQIEDFDRLHSSVLRLFPDADDPHQRATFSSPFRRTRVDISAGHWQHLGYITRKADGRVFGRPRRAIVDLPSQIDYIHVSLFKVLPSLFVLVFDVFITDKASEALREIQERFYLPRIRCRPWIFHGLERSEYSITSAETIKQLSIAAWKSDIRRATYSVLEPYIIYGDFRRSSTSYLPSIDVYYLDWVEMPSDVEHALDAASRWLQAIGFWWALSYTGRHIAFALDQPLTDGVLHNDYQVLIISARM